ncbi:hypothetical protein [Streptomyces rapamycinicus]|uniref:Uncharacterized protein n=2 Tax=Streptomyces rapamycinicus TaxID=1226757 RepID=A0A0A0NDR3_STRRN|nr:hypothetical protein [Streptomyces rapamycinicus]AGP52570.1 hypothetical protein M271_04715 [Streptomyces rapamycinicus NRRL 5491]MBB4780034.1 hypothetical protein [Streptomyces rapamycinicus]RLV75311.1 hypothetical protein D3C57_138835 [Streptomyces rapamycinicus NRRL 5491]UTP28737.1 hypothetical protein LIV37_04825 [Streptomyces rapamycinicus NRRL 5491]
MRTDCGCGCGGDATRTSAFVRPRFFAGQLLTEDDLSLLVEYTTAKARLHNRSLYGPGVICGLGVTCDPCGGGTVAVHPGHALDRAGNDIVVPCTERVDVTALVRERRINALGVDCGEDCDNDGDEGGRRYGLYVRYRELPVEPVTPYATEEPCPSPGCVPSRIQEGYQFVVKCDDSEDHRHNPGTRLLMTLGDLARADRARTRDRRLGFYTDALTVASLGTGRAFRFDAADAQRYATSFAWLRDNAGGEGPPAPPTAREQDGEQGVAAAFDLVVRIDVLPDPEYGRPARPELGEAVAVHPAAVLEVDVDAEEQGDQVRVAGEDPARDVRHRIGPLRQATALGGYGQPPGQQGEVHHEVQGVGARVGEHEELLGEADAVALPYHLAGPEPPGVEGPGQARHRRVVVA